MPDSINHLKAITLLFFAVFLCSQSAFVDSKTPVFSDYLGSWQSNDNAFGMDAISRLTFSHEYEGKITRLTYEVKAVQDTGYRRFFAGNGFYQAAKNQTSTGTWVDSNGDIYAITLSIQKGEMVSQWGPLGTTLGKTHYRLIDGLTLQVTDYLFNKGTWQVFNDVYYTRVASTKPIASITTEENSMEKVLGIGGVFFKADNTDLTAKWYLDNLGIDRTPSDYDTLPWMQEAGPTVFAPFEKDTHYFGDDKQQWMINFRVSNLDKMVSQLKNNGIAVDVDPEIYPNGRFARLVDPNGNPIQLWEPAM